MTPEEIARLERLQAIHSEHGSAPSRRQCDVCLALRAAAAERQRAEAAAAERTALTQVLRGLRDLLGREDSTFNDALRRINAALAAAPPADV